MFCSVDNWRMHESSLNDGSINLFTDHGVRVADIFEESIRLSATTQTVLDVNVSKPTDYVMHQQV
jgi:hypothetical protein